jgi:hypothetical protein
LGIVLEQVERQIEEGVPVAKEKAICLQVGLGKFGIRRNVDNDRIEVKESNTNRQWLRTRKRILESPEYDRIAAADNWLRAQLGKYCLSRVLQSGIYLLPLGLVEKVDGVLSTFQAQREELVEKFLLAYSQRVVEAREELDQLFEADNYPSPEVMRAEFTVKVNYLTFGAPESLQTVSRSLYEREKQAAQEEWDVAMREAKDLLRLQFSMLIDRAKDRLQPDASGKPRKFKNATFEKVREFIELFDLRNITDDQDLKKVVDRAKAITEGLNPDEIRTNEEIRKGVTEAFSALASQLDVMDIPKRKIDLDDE